MLFVQDEEIPEDGPKIWELVEKENVDILAYIGWEEKKDKKEKVLL